MSSDYFGDAVAEGVSTNTDIGNNPQEDSFDLPNVRAAINESRATEHSGPFYSYHNEKALKLVRLCLVLSLVRR